MERKPIELTAIDDIRVTHGLYKQCMYMPAEEELTKKIESFLADDATKKRRFAIGASL